MSVSQNAGFRRCHAELSSAQTEAGSWVPAESLARRSHKRAGSGLSVVILVVVGCGGGSAASDGGLSDHVSKDGAPSTVDAHPDVVQNGCGGDSGTLHCCTDLCGNELVAECQAGRWVCPVISHTSSCVDASGTALGVACGSGSCPSGMVCEVQTTGVGLWACTPFPASCPSDAGWSETCDCLIESQGSVVCGALSPSCLAPDGGFVVGCVVGSGT